MGRSALVPALLLIFAFARCGGRVSSGNEPSSAPARAGGVCDETNSKAIGESGCDVCVCVDGRWSCDGQDCACEPGSQLFWDDGCIHCPCETGKFRCTYEPCVVCPPPTPGVSCSNETVWARDPSSGLCCKYERPCEVPFGLETYSSAVECNPFGCSCDLDPEAPPQPLGCGCPLTGCSTLSDALNEACTSGQPDIRLRRGCGRIELVLYGGFSGWTLLFDETTGTLLGSSTSLDMAHGACSLYFYEFGEVFNCPEINECQLCSRSSNPESPPVCVP